MNEIMINLMLGVISVFIIKNYIEIILEKKNIKFFWLFWISNFLLDILLEMNSGVPLFNLLLNFVFIFYICVVGYKGYIKQKLVVSFSIIIIWGIVEIVMGYISQLIQLHFFSQKIQGSILSKLFTLLFVEIIRYLKVRCWSETSTKIIPKYWWMMIALPASSVMIVYYIFLLVGQCGNLRMIWGGILSSCLFLLLNSGILRIYDLLASEYELRQQNAVYAQSINLCSKEMKEKEVALSNRQLVHDYKKHLTAMQQIAVKYQYKEIERYYAGLDFHVTQDKILVNCGNLVIDALINSKYSVAVKEGIQYVANVTVPVDMQFENADLCVVLGNGLDNAYEAVRKMNEKLIRIAIVYSVGKITIGIKNTYDGLLDKNKHDDYRISKKEKKIMVLV